MLQLQSALLNFLIMDGLKCFFCVYKSSCMKDAGVFDTFTFFSEVKNSYSYAKNYSETIPVISLYCFIFKQKRCDSTQIYLSFLLKTYMIRQMICFCRCFLRIWEITLHIYLRVYIVICMLRWCFKSLIFSTVLLFNREIVPYMILSIQ